MGKLTTHVLDTSTGRPANGMRVRLFGTGRSGKEMLLASIATNADGRCDKPLLEGRALRPGKYRLEFSAGAYFRGKGVKLPAQPFLDVVTVTFGVEDTADYHVPLLLSPYGYSTYRGS